MPPAVAKPIAMDDHFQTSGELERKAPGLIGNDVVPGPVRIVIVEQPSHGTLTVGDDGAFTYVRDRGYRGVDTFRYQLVSASGTSGIATVSIRQGPVQGGVLPIRYGVGGATGHEGAGMADDQKSVSVGGLSVFNFPFEWMVPSVALSVPGLLLTLILLAQTAGAALWLPWIGRFRRGMTWRPVAANDRTR
jgi:hypothetical protein